MGGKPADPNVIVAATTPAPEALRPARYALRSRAVPAAVLGLMVGIFAIDYVTPQGMTVGPLYAAPIIVALFSAHWRRNAFLTALIASVFLPIGVFVSSDDFDVHWIVVCWNRSIGLLVIWAAWYVGIRAKKAFDTITDSEGHLRISAENLARSNAELEQFAYVASHDLQEPLRAVSGCVQILQKRYHDQLDAYAGELIGHTVAGAARMQTLIHDLLAFSRIGTRGKEFEPTECNAVVNQALANLAVAVKESAAQVTVADLPTVQADATQLTHLFQNLIGNAVKYRGERAVEIHVAADRQQTGWRFRVRDNGIGIAPEYFARIFVIFQRLHTRKEYTGTGIGLAICKKVVERHGGRIWLESEPGNGSTFFFTLPDPGATP